MKIPAQMKRCWPFWLIWLGIVPLQAQSGYTLAPEPEGVDIHEVAPAQHLTSAQIRTSTLAGTRLEAADWLLAHRNSSLTGIHERYQLYWQGVRVEQSFLTIHLSADEEVMSWAVNMPEHPLPDYTVTFPDEEVILHRAAKQTGLVPEQAEPVWALTDQGMVPALRISFPPGRDEKVWDIWVDAETGQELYRQDRAAYFHLTNGDTTGIGRIFHPNPCTAANVDYGDLFIDSMDAHQAIFETLMDTVLLQDIQWDADSGVFRLNGPYVSVTAKSGTSVDPVTSTDGTFYFRRDSSGFEDVMVYYHIDRYQRYVQRLGFMNLQNGPLPADAHGFTSDVSAFVPNNGNSYLLFGTGNVDDGEDADVIIHEYIHALSYAAAPETNSGRERRGLDEGYGDYFAAAHSWDITPNKWQLIFNWDGHNEFWDGRIANVSETYPPGNSLSIYAYGSVWCSALMKMRFEMGDTIMDRIALESLYFLDAGMDFLQAGRQLIRIDSLLYGGSHRETIRKYLCAHRIDVDPLVPCLVVGEEMEEDIRRQFHVYPNPAHGSFQVEWEARPDEVFLLGMMNALGQVVQEVEVRGGQATMVTDLPAGTYFLRLSDRKGQQVIRQISLLP